MASLCIIWSLFLRRLCAQTIIASTEQYKDGTIQCQHNSACFVYCKEEGSCQNANILCPINRECIVSCGKHSNACNGAVVDARYSSLFELNDCASGDSSTCSAMSIYFPPNNNGQKISFLNVGNNFKHALKLYAIYGWLDVDASGYTGDFEEEIDGVMYCTFWYESSCQIEDNGWECDNNGDYCNNPSMSDPPDDQHNVIVTTLSATQDTTANTGDYDDEHEFEDDDTSTSATPTDIDDVSTTATTDDDTAESSTTSTTASTSSWGTTNRQTEDDEERAEQDDNDGREDGEDESDDADGEAIDISSTSTGIVMMNSNENRMENVGHTVTGSASQFEYAIAGLIGFLCLCTLLFSYYVTRHTKFYRNAMDIDKTIEHQRQKSMNARQDHRTHHHHQHEHQKTQTCHKLSMEETDEEMQSEADTEDTNALPAQHTNHHTHPHVHVQQQQSMKLKMNQTPITRINSKSKSKSKSTPHLPCNFLSQHSRASNASLGEPPIPSDVQQVPAHSAMHLSPSYINSGHEGQPKQLVHHQSMHLAIDRHMNHLHDNHSVDVIDMDGDEDGNSSMMANPDCMKASEAGHPAESVDNESMFGRSYNEHLKYKKPSVPVNKLEATIEEETTTHSIMSRLSSLSDIKIAGMFDYFKINRANKQMKADGSENPQTYTRSNMINDSDDDDDIEIITHDQQSSALSAAGTVSTSLPPNQPNMPGKQHRKSQTNSYIKTQPRSYSYSKKNLSEKSKTKSKCLSKSKSFHQAAFKITVNDHSGDSSSDSMMDCLQHSNHGNAHRNMPHSVSRTPSSMLPPVRREMYSDMDDEVEEAETEGLSVAKSADDADSVDAHLMHNHHSNNHTQNRLNVGHYGMTRSHRLQNLHCPQQQHTDGETDDDTLFGRNIIEQMQTESESVRMQRAHTDEVSKDNLTVTSRRSFSEDTMETTTESKKTCMVYGSDKADAMSADTWISHYNYRHHKADSYAPSENSK